MPTGAASHPGLGVLSCAAQPAGRPASFFLLLSRLLIAFRHESPFTRAHLTFRLSAPLCVSAAVSEALSSSPPPPRARRESFGCPHKHCLSKSSV